MLTFESQKIQGSQSIVAKLTTLLSSSVSTTSPPSIVSPLALAACWFSSVVPSNLPANSMISSSAKIEQFNKFEETRFKLESN
uniref:Uncharacterized protein n=1 Tax=Gossypium raimondii TaxID=29730 RepID=A0A0D2QK14_GOSRA|nr:hypothetical protein B456_003G118900 [Gossypium raimondii]KJB17280.1 hypothetical protein B456_003G118900 [Gossypium raimondii]KJB17281.1 hypothetical protein B456_003G118900 [Gossypium raimondii]KJB17285.1 hypothetical protein B456_003G118900 [Gossypium raimondii]